MYEFIALLERLLQQGLRIEIEVKMAGDDERIVVRCPDCDWVGSYDNADSAKKGLRTHRSRHCPARHDAPSDSFLRRNGDGQ